ncbi:hypothetical protein PspLS_06734 [Pyricularia sp. CBS 133598]|nr:hypothetical protein PspLS_06734 [Pyricularia sp. CBS 133598]
MLWLFQALFSIIFLLSIVLSIPICFDVGGRDAGLAYSLSLFVFYLFYSAAKLATPDNSRFRRALTELIRLSQWVVIPALLIWSLNRFSVDEALLDAAQNHGHASGDWVRRAWFGHETVAQPAAPAATNWHDWFFGSKGVLESMWLGSWDRGLSYSSPLFQLCEGFCTVLVIQAAGQMTRWLVNRGRSDTWVIVLLVISSSILTSAAYFLWRIMKFPQINNIDATLIGVTITSAVFLGAYGISSGRGNPIESSLLFAYVVLCVYQIFTDYMPSDPAAAEALAAAQAAQQPEFPPLPPFIMASWSTLRHMLASLPEAFNVSFTFLYAAFQTVTPSVIISLAYRITVFYCATRIIPAVRESGTHALMEDPELYGDSSDGATKLLSVLSWFSPSILIAVYTSLLLQHFTVAADSDIGWTLTAGDVGGNPWRWVNVGATMLMYSLELYLGDDEPAAHWKSD